MTTATATRRFGYMTNSVPNLQAARALALPEGHAVDMLPVGTTPEVGAYDGIVVDLAAGAGHALARKAFLARLVKLAKRFPVVVCDRAASYQEAALMRAAGIKWLPAIKAKAFEMMLAHPAARVEIDLADCEEEEAAPAAG